MRVTLPAGSFVEWHALSPDRTFVYRKLYLPHLFISLPLTTYLLQSMHRNTKWLSLEIGTIKFGKVVVAAFHKK